MTTRPVGLRSRFVGVGVGLACAGGCQYEQQLGTAEDASLGDAPAAIADADGADRCMPTPGVAPGFVVVCGQLVDVQTRRAVDLGGVEGCRPCAADDDTGPCALTVRAFDAFSYGQNPTTSPPLPADVTVFDTGEYCIENLPAPATGMVAVEVRDAEDAPVMAHLPTASVMWAAPGAVIDNHRLFAVRESVDDRWTSSAGSPFGTMGASSFLDVGSMLVLFSSRNDGRAGVSVLVDDAPRPEASYYIADTPPGMVDVDPNLEATASSGALLLVTEGRDLSGTGGEPPGCVWPTSPAATVPGVVVVVDLGASGAGCAAP